MVQKYLFEGNENGRNDRNAETETENRQKENSEESGEENREGKTQMSDPVINSIPPVPPPQDEDSKPFFRASNVWRLIGLASIGSSHFVRTPELKTDWFSISSLAGVGIVLVVWPLIQEGIDLYSKRK